jgi:hypothetical protein
MNISVIVSAKLLLLFRREASHRLLDIALGVLAADHEADLARGIGGNSRVCVFDDGEDFFAGFLQVGDQG